MFDMTMKDHPMTKAQLIAELKQLRGKVHRLEQKALSQPPVREVKAHQSIDESLQKLDVTFRTLIEQLPNVVIYIGALDNNSTTLYVSPQVEPILGYTQAEYKADPDIWANRIHPDDYDRVMAEVARSHESGGRLVTEYRMIRKDGREIWFHDEADIVRDSTGNPLYLLGVNTDISDRKANEEKLLKYQEQLRSLALELSLIEQRERRRLATDLHDSVCQLLALSKLKLDLLCRKSTSDALNEELLKVRELVRQAIEQTRPLTFELSPPTLYELGLQAALKEFAANIKKLHNIEIEFSSEDQPQPLGEDLLGFIFRAVQELLVNVVKHSQAPKAKVSMRMADDQFIQIEVEDNGIGFDAAQTNAYMNRKNCFGLFSIKERLQYLGGYFEVVSSPGRGTRAVLKVPY